MDTVAFADTLRGVISGLGVGVVLTTVIISRWPRILRLTHTDRDGAAK